MPDVCRARIVRAVGEPQREIAALQPAGDLHAVLDVLNRTPPHFGIGIAERAELVDLILEQVGIDRPGPDAVLLTEPRHGVDAAQPVLEVPQDVQRERRADPGELVHVPGIGEFLFDGAGRSRLKKLAKPRARVREPPRGHFDAEYVKGRGHAIDWM